MSFFGLGKVTDRYGVVIDVGSGSVLVAIVHSNSDELHPQIIWSHREHAPLRNIDSLEQSAKAVMTALMNAAMLLDSEGRKALRTYNESARISEIQCGICAPWSYTVTKTIRYKQEDDFMITDDLIKELISTVQEQINSDIKANEEVQKLGLQIITRATMETLANGYQIKNPIGEKAKEFSIAQSSAVSQKYLLDALADTKKKLFSGSDCRKLSFILMLYIVTRELFPAVPDICLVDVTYEATEIGIVRSNTLTYCTHTPFGSFSLTRELSATLNIPLHEAFASLHTSTPYTFMEKLNAEKRAEVKKIFESYTQKLSDLFKETGDSLSIPKRISLHTDLDTESLFADLIEKAVKRNIKTEPKITPISRQIIQKTYAESTKKTTEYVAEDTALLLSAHFFHTHSKQGNFEYF